jgi:uncharacterized protein YbjT (DUF2867 family)
LHLTSYKERAMTLRVLVVGAYGNFGRIVIDHLSQLPGIELVLTGRDARQLSLRLAELPGHASWCGDVLSPAFAQALPGLDVQWVVHTGGPFQGQAYSVAQACIAAGVNYCDLADCRAFVNGIGVLDEQAREAGVVVLSGCSSVPTLSSAIIDEHRHLFWRIDTIEHGITSSAKMPGLSTVEGVLAYAGRPIDQWREGRPYPVTGWLGLSAEHVPELGWRLVANVDVPDMDIFAHRYGARSLSFKAGSGLWVGGLANAALALAIKSGLVRSTTPWACRLYRWGCRFERFGNGRSALYMKVHGLSQKGQPLTLRAQVTAFEDKGPEIPSCAAVALLHKVSLGHTPEPGARPCVGEITVQEYLAAIGAPDKVFYQVSQC